jgi:hypothetical protein
MSEPQFSMVISEAKRERYEDAMSDVVCWLDGFTSAGKEYAPDTLQVLREIQADIKMCHETIPPGLSPPTVFTVDYLKDVRQILFEAAQGIGTNSRTANAKLSAIKKLAEKILYAK